ncbi:MAG: anti-sigma factor [Nitrospirota bacterium]
MVERESVSHETFEEALPLYAVGALDRQDRQPIEAHLLTGCPVCHAALKEYRAAAGLLPYGLPPVPAPPSLKGRIVGALAQKPSVQETAKPAEPPPRLEPGRWLNHVIPPEPPWYSVFFRPAFVLVLTLAVAGTGFYAWTLRSRVLDESVQRQHVEAALQAETARLATLQRQVAEQERLLAGLREEITHRSGDVGDLLGTLTEREAELDRLRAQASDQQREIAGLRKTLAQRDEMLAFLRSPNVKVVSLAGADQAKSAGALLLFDPESKKAFFYGFNMPPLPAGKTYQLWAIAGKPISAGVFGTDAGQKSRLVIRSIPDPADVAKFAVSMEPEGGRPQPTGEIYLVGQL